jgi:hypothetical protein
VDALDVTAEQLLAWAEEHTRIGTQIAPAPGVLAAHIAEVQATHGPIGLPLVAGLTVGAQTYGARAAQHAADYATYGQRFVEHAAAYTDQDAASADAVRQA